MKSAMHEHQQRARQQRMNEAMASQEWAVAARQIQAGHGRELADFRGRGEDVMKKMRYEYQRNTDKLRKQTHDKLEELERQKQKMRLKLNAGCQQLRQRYLSRHNRKIANEKEALKGDEAEKEDIKPVEATSKPHLEDKPELKQPEPIQSEPPWVEALTERSGGAARQKHRKSQNSQHTSRQFSIEVHNEGVWICVISEGDDKKKPTVSTQRQEFLPWGLKAYAVLESVVCGEIPQECERLLEMHPNVADTVVSQGGQIRTVLWDLRTSEATASAQRAAAMKEQEEKVVNDLEAKLAELGKLVTKSDADAKRFEMLEKEQASGLMGAEERFKEAKRIQEEFRKKYSKYFNPGMFILFLLL